MFNNNFEMFSEAMINDFEFHRHRFFAKTTVTAILLFSSLSENKLQEERSSIDSSMLSA